jgi:hemoglobin/transferrin/lactoferrin receptor protein
MNLMQKVRFRPNNNWDFQFGVHYSETSDYSRYDRLVETDRTGSPVYAVWNYGPQIWMMHNFLVSHQNTSRIYDKITLRVAQQYFEESRTDRRFNHHRLRTQLEAVHAYSANLDFEKDNQKHRYGYGAEYIFNDVKSTGSAVDIRNGKLMLVPDRYPASEWRSCAAYLNYQYLASIKFLFQAGVRYSAINIQSDFRRHLTFYPFDFTTSSLQNSAITGSFGVIFRPGESWKISANASTGFRAPNVDDIGKIFDFAVGEVVVPNTSLKSEYAYHGEIGINKIFGDGVKFDATGFYTFLDQAMVRRPFQVNRQDSIPYNGIMSKVYAIQNAASAMVYGFNAGIELKFPSGFGLSSRFNYQLGNEEMDNGEKSRSRHAAPAFGNTRLFYQKNKLHLQFHVIYCAEVSYKNLNIEERQKPSIYAKDANGKPYSPGWYTLNFEAMYQFHQFLSISSGVENITDKRYRPYSSGLVAPERNFIISLRAVF